MKDNYSINIIIDIQFDSLSTWAFAEWSLEVLESTFYFWLRQGSIELLTLYDIFQMIKVSSIMGFLVLLRYSDLRHTDTQKYETVFPQLHWT